jgi:hypothetical protein
MQMTTGLIALALLGAEGAGPPPAGEHITTEVRILTMRGLDWRAPVHAGLNIVSHRDGTTVWTASRETAAEIAKAAENLVSAPKVSHPPGAPASICAGVSRSYVAQLGRIADGPPNRATAVAWEPGINSLQEGCRVEVKGVAMDQGVLMKADLCETRFLAFHTVSCPEVVQPKEKGQKATKVAATYQVPEVSTSRVSGEWLVPKDGVLVVSLGVHTEDGPKGKPALTERLVMISARGTPDATKPALTLGHPRVLGQFNTVYAGVEGAPNVRFFAAAPDPFVNRVTFVAVPVPVPATMPPAAHPMPISVSGLNAISRPAARRMPSPPSRALPQGVSPDGTVVPLPPLPDDELEEASAEEESAEPRPTPQVRPQAKPKPAPEDAAEAKRNVVEAFRSAPVIARVPIGPFTGEARLHFGTPNRLMVGLKLGTVDVAPVVDEAVTRTSASTEPKRAPASCPASAPAPKRSAKEQCEDEGECCESAAKGLTLDLDVSASELIQGYFGLESARPKMKPAASDDRPLRIEWPVGDGSIAIEFRSRKTSGR